MFIIIEKTTKIVHGVGTTYTPQPNGHQVGSYIYAYPDEYEVIEVTELPLGIQPGQYCYDALQGFIENPTYAIRSHNQMELLERVALAEQALNYIIMNGGNI